MKVDNHNSKKVEEYYNKNITALTNCEKLSENDFESKIVYISASALGLSVAIFKNTEDLTWRALLIMSWILLSLSLSINCFSAHHIRLRCRKLKERIDKSKDAKESTDYTKNCASINNVANTYNTLNIVFTVTGTFLLIIFASKNLFS